MTPQFDLFDGAHEAGPKLPEGFRYRPELIGPADEDKLLAHVRELPFRDFEFHGYTGKRRVVSFGRHYDFSGRRLRKADDIPDYLLELRTVAAPFGEMEPEMLQLHRRKLEDQLGLPTLVLESNLLDLVKDEGLHLGRMEAEAA